MLILYYKTSCPYCHKVINFAEAENISLDLKDIYADHQNLDELMELGGKRQVPFLVDQDRQIQMYESDDIVKYLDENYVHQSQSNS